MAARNGSGFWKKVKWIFLRAVMVVVLVLFGLEFVNLQHQEAKPVEGGGRAERKTRIIRLRPWMHWGAAGRRTVNWGRSSSPRSPGGPSG